MFYASHNNVWGVLGILTPLTGTIWRSSSSFQKEGLKGLTKVWQNIL